MPPAAKRRKTSAVQATAPTNSNTSPKAEVELAQYPGFSSWHANLHIEGGESGMSKFDKSTKEFMHSAKIYDADAFKLKPLTIVDGPLKGRHVLMLEPIKDHFRFMDLPAEIRNIIYDMVFDEPEDIRIRNYKTPSTTRRSVRSTFRSAHKGMTWDAKTTKWLGQEPSAHALLRVSRQIQAEAAPIAYGSHSFAFMGFQELRTFLDNIGSMRQFLRHIIFCDDDYHRSLASPVFSKLKEAKSLRSFTFVHSGICEQREFKRKHCEPQQLAKHCRTMMKAIQKAQKSSDNPYNVLDIIKIRNEPWRAKCTAYTNGGDCTCYYNYCDVKCRDKRQHMKELEGRIRKALADELGIKDS